MNHFSPSTRSSNAGGPAAETVGWNAPHLVFEVNAQPYACPIAKIQRLVRAADTIVNPRLESAPAWETGRLMASDGEGEISVISLRTLWGLPVLGESAGRRQAFLIADLRGAWSALQVDACLCVLSSLPPKSSSFPLPAALKGVRSLGLGVAAPWKQLLLVTLDLDELLQPEYQKPLRPLPVLPQHP